MPLWLFASLAKAQTEEGEPFDTTMVSIKHYMLDSIDVSPQAIDTKGMLLLNPDIQMELGGAVDNLYNFKYALAEKQFKSLRRRYPTHPMPYFLMGLSQWWKIVPTNIQTKQYDHAFFAYMDTTITYAEKLYEKDKKNVEAAFFLAAANGFAARLHSERSNWRKATVYSKRALEYLEKSNAGNDLSPEFMFGDALFNYYAVWIKENYALLRPVLLFFPNGNKSKGLTQLKTVAANGFYTGVEAKFFLMKILANEENNASAAMPISRYLVEKYPDNAYFQRFYARLAFVEGNFRDAELVSLSILDKLDKNMPGYEAISGRYASYFLGYINQNKYKDFAKAKEYYLRCLQFTEQTGERESGYYIYANLNLGRIYDKEKQYDLARKYFTVVKDAADKKSESYKEARAYLKKKSQQKKK